MPRNVLTTSWRRKAPPALRLRHGSLGETVSEICQVATQEQADYCGGFTGARTVSRCSAVSPNGSSVMRRTVLVVRLPQPTK
jgi:hypothetical protein